MPTVFIGESRLPKDFKRYAKQFSLLELDCEPGSIPGKNRLQACAARAPKGFVFSLVVPTSISSLESNVGEDKAWKAALAAAEILKARWWVVRTPANVRPTRRVREQLGALFARLREGGRRVAWEPRGVWDEAVAAETAQALGAHLVQDVAREAPLAEGVLYSRLLALGRGAKVGLSLADRVADLARGYDEAFIIVEGRGAEEIRKALELNQPGDDELGVAGLAVSDDESVDGESDESDDDESDESDESDDDESDDDESDDDESDDDESDDDESDESDDDESDDEVP